MSSGMMNLVVIDDQESILQEVQRFLMKIDHVNLVLSTTDVNELFSFIEETDLVNVILLDINMPLANGFDIAQYLREKYPAIKIIFMSAYPDFALQGYKYYPEDFLAKPINFMRLKYTLDRIDAQTVKRKRIGIKAHGKISLLDVEDILFAEKKGRKTLIHLQDTKQVECSEGLNKIEEMLANDNFFRTHQSYLVALDQIESIESDNFMKSYNVKLKGYSHSISLSRHRYVVLKDLIKHYL